MVPVMDRPQRLIYLILVTIWVISITVFWRWWLQPEHTTSLFGSIFNSLLLTWSMAMPAYFYYFAGRMKRPNPDLLIPRDKKIAIIVTKAPSEPFPVLQKTLMAMINQDYPYNFDVWLADESPTNEVIDWCNEHGVLISTREDFNIFGVDGYQNQEFPRRTRSKEGNLSYFYDTHADKYDFVSQLDADHVPTPSYLREMMRPFVNPEVGYVAAPSICDANSEESWVVNARLFMEASLHGALQAGYNGQWQPMAIGSHYAVRVAALKELKHVRNESFWGGKEMVIDGGLGPELAEDHTTTLAMTSRGYEGAFALEAIAHGDGAPSITDSVTQEMQWSRSLMTVLLRWTPSYFRKGVMSPRLKLQFLFAQMWYPIFAFHMLISYQMSNLALLMRRPWVNVNYIVFLLYFIPTIIAGLLPIVWLKKLGVLRPADSRVMSWQQVLFVYVRWPWALFGVLQAIIGTIFLNKELKFKVTPKGDTGARKLPLSLLLPYFAIVLLATITVIAIANPANARGYYFLSMWSALEYTATICAIIYLHWRENRAKLEESALKFFAQPLLIAILSVGLLVAAMLLRGLEAFNAILYYGAG